MTAAYEWERVARAASERDRDVAREQRQRTREALDVMTSQVASDWLAAQQKLLPQQAIKVLKRLAARPGALPGYRRDLAPGFHILGDLLNDVALLRRAFALGHRDVAQLLKDHDLGPLRGRADYVALLWDLADGVPQASN